MSKAINQFINDLMDAWNAHDIERTVAFYAPDYVGIDVAQARPQHGPEGIRQMLTRYARAFPDLHFSTDETIIQGNRVALVWTGRGTHLGPLMNIPPTGRKIEIRGVSLLTVERNQVLRADYIWDVAGLLRSIGLLPEL
jgi:steroid delta-isomerase-like uncharacterized protein